MGYKVEDFFTKRGDQGEGGYQEQGDSAKDWYSNQRGAGSPNAGFYGAQGDDDDLSYKSDTENPDPYAWQMNKQGFSYGQGVGPSANDVATRNRDRSTIDRYAPTYQMDAGMQQQARAMQGMAGDYYRRQMEGKVPSVAEMQMRQGLASSNAAASGMAASARGGGSNLAAAQRAAIRQQGMNNSNIAQQAAQLRAQEQGMGAQGLGSLGGQIRQGDQGWEMAKAQQEAQQRALNVQSSQGWEKLAQAPELAQLQASQNYEMGQKDAENEARQRRWDQEKTNTEYAREDQGGFFGGIGKLFGGFM